MTVNPYLSFEGRCEEAIEFYKRAIGAEVQTLMRFKEMPAGACPDGKTTPGTENKILHSALRIGDSTVLASDGRCTGHSNFGGVSLTLTAANDAQAQKAFTALSNGGQVTLPLGKTFFSSSFGMLNDRFGVPWMIIVQA
jgi:PhnB protein